MSVLTGSKVKAALDAAWVDSKYGKYGSTGESGSNVA